MVALGRFDELRESVAVLIPVELAAVDDDAGDRCSMSSYPFCGAVDYIPVSGGGKIKIKKLKREREEENRISGTYL